MDDKKISRKGFLAFLFSGVAGLFLSQLPGKELFVSKQNTTNGYGNNTYGGGTR